MQLGEVQKKMSELKTVLEESCLMAEKVVTDKMNKQKYVEQEKAVQSRIDRLLQEVNAMVQTL